MTAPDLVNAVWRKSSRSANTANCVEVAFGTVAQELAVAARDSKNPAGPALVFADAEWSTFLTSARVGRFMPSSC